MFYYYTLRSSTQINVEGTHYFFQERLEVPTCVAKEPPQDYRTRVATRRRHLRVLAEYLRNLNCVRSSLQQISPYTFLVRFLGLDGVLHPEHCQESRHFCCLPVFEQVLRRTSDWDVVITSTGVFKLRSNSYAPGSTVTLPIASSVSQQNSASWRAFLSRSRLSNGNSNATVATYK